MDVAVGLPVAYLLQACLHAERAQLHREPPVVGPRVPRARDPQQRGDGRRLGRGVDARGVEVLQDLHRPALLAAAAALRRERAGRAERKAPQEGQAFQHSGLHDEKLSWAQGTRPEVAVPLSILSPAFAPGGAIPARFTCDGDDVSPPLRFTGVPHGTRSLALIVDDPDAPDPAAPRMIYVHWILYDLPPTAEGLAEGAARGGLPAGTREGLNDWHRTGWGGPCPPIGRHRYFFKLYALDTALGDLGRARKTELLAAIQGHLLAEAELVGTYQRG